MPSTCAPNQARPWFNAIVLLLAAVGCSSPTRVAKVPQIDASQATADAMKLFDANGDGALDSGELAKCAPLAILLPSADANKDSKLSEEELATRLKQIVPPNSSYASAACTVTLSGRPLAGAVVKLRPVEIFGGAVPTAEATTNDLGVAQPSIGADLLPPKLANAGLTFPGVYHVEITHAQSQLPARYNTATELSWVIDASARDGAGARFDLKAQ